MLRKWFPAALSSVGKKWSVFLLCLCCVRYPQVELSFSSPTSHPTRHGTAGRTTAKIAVAPLPSVDSFNLHMSNLEDVFVKVASGSELDFVRNEFRFLGGDGAPDCVSFGYDHDDPGFFEGGGGGGLLHDEELSFCGGVPGGGGYALDVGRGSSSIPFPRKRKTPPPSEAGAVARVRKKNAPTYASVFGRRNNKRGGYYNNRWGILGGCGGYHWRCLSDPPGVVRARPLKKKQKKSWLTLRKAFSNMRRFFLQLWTLLRWSKFQRDWNCLRFMERRAPDQHHKKFRQNGGTSNNGTNVLMSRGGSRAPSRRTSVLSTRSQNSRRGSSSSLPKKSTSRNQKPAKTDDLDVALLKKQLQEVEERTGPSIDAFDSFGAPFPSASERGEGDWSCTTCSSCCPSRSANRRRPGVAGGRSKQNFCEKSWTCTKQVFRVFLENTKLIFCALFLDKKRRPKALNLLFDATVGLLIGLLFFVFLMKVAGVGEMLDGLSDSAEYFGMFGDVTQVLGLRASGTLHKDAFGNLRPPREISVVSNDQLRGILLHFSIFLLTFLFLALLLLKIPSWLVKRPETEHDCGVKEYHGGRIRVILSIVSTSTPIVGAILKFDLGPAIGK